MSFNSTVLHGVRRFSLYFHTAEDAVKGLKFNIKTNLIIPEDFNLAVFSYDHQRLPNADMDNPASYPLKFFSKDKKQEVWVSGIGAGFIEGAAGTLEALELMGFILTPKEKETLIQPRQKICLRILKTD